RGIESGGIKSGHYYDQTRVWLKRDSIFRQIKGSRITRLVSRGLDRRSRSGGSRFILSGGDTADYHQNENDRKSLSHIAITKRGHMPEYVVGSWDTLPVTFRSIKDALGRAPDDTGALVEFAFMNFHSHVARGCLVGRLIQNRER